MGQKQISAHVRVMSALPPKADMLQHDRDVLFVLAPAIAGNSLDRRVRNFPLIVAINHPSEHNRNPGRGKRDLPRTDGR
jgi:hypothetical protein